MEIFKTLSDNFRSPIKNSWETAAVLATLLREDILFVDKILYRWTVRKQEGFFSYSEIFRIRFSDVYGCDPLTGRVVPVTAKTVNYPQLKSILLSNSPELFD